MDLSFWHVNIYTINQIALLYIIINNLIDCNFFNAALYFYFLVPNNLLNNTNYLANEFVPDILKAFGKATNYYLYSNKPPKKNLIHFCRNK